MDDLKRALRLRRMSMDALVKRVTSSSTSHGDPLEKYGYEVVEIDDRLPSDLRDWYAHILYNLMEPWHLRGGRGGSDEAYIEHWRAKRDRLHPELNPDYKPPRKGQKGQKDDDGDAGAPLPPQ